MVVTEDGCETWFVSRGKGKVGHSLNEKINRLLGLRPSYVSLRQLHDCRAHSQSCLVGDPTRRPPPEEGSHQVSSSTYTLRTNRKGPGPVTSSSVEGN